MGITKSDLAGRDAFVDHDFEEVMFRYDHKNRFCGTQLQPIAILKKSIDLLACQ